MIFRKDGGEEGGEDKDEGFEGSRTDSFVRAEVEEEGSVGSGRERGGKDFSAFSEKSTERVV